METPSEATLPPLTTVVLMGVSGSGKTTIGQLLAERTGMQFADGDDFHSEANKHKMASGEALTDVDRQPWLERLNGLLRQWQAAGHGGVLACSALKSQYRETLSAHLTPGNLHFVLLDVPQAILAQRLAGRHHAFMSPALLQSQLATLERPDAGEAVVVCNDRSPDEVVTELIDKLKPKATASAYPPATARATSTAE